MAELASSTDLAYLAGFIDGEGSIGTTRTGARRQVVGRLTITNTDLAMLKMLQAKYGGSITRQPRSANPEWKPYCAITWTNRGALRVLEAVLPYLIIKRRQAELCIRLIRMRDAPRSRRYSFIHSPTPRMPSRHVMIIHPQIAAIEHEIAAELKALNRRGVTSSDLPPEPAIIRSRPPVRATEPWDLFSILSEVDPS